jgi:hypothetical protein
MSELAASEALSVESVSSADDDQAVVVERVSDPPVEDIPVANP